MKIIIPNCFQKFQIVPKIANQVEPATARRLNFNGRDLSRTRADCRVRKRKPTNQNSPQTNTRANRQYCPTRDEMERAIVDFFFFIFTADSKKLFLVIPLCVHQLSPWIKLRLLFAITVPAYVEQLGSQEAIKRARGENKCTHWHTLVRVGLGEGVWRGTNAKVKE